MTKTLKEKTISALIWSFVDKYGQQAVYIITGVIVARILSPSDYGLVGMLTIFVAVSTILIDGGFGYSLIREKNVDNVDFSTVFIFNMIISVVLYVVLFFCAPLIADFYEQPKLTQLSRIVFLSIPINAFAIIQNIILVKNIQFHITAKINLFSLTLSGVISIVIALLGFGVWAVICQTLLYAVFRTCLLWIQGTWKISLKFSNQRFKRIFPFSSNLLASNMLMVFLNNIYTSTIGKIFPLNQAGYYTQASKYADLSTMVTSVVQGTMFPVLSTISDDEERLKRACRKTVRALAFFLFPISCGLVLVAKPLFIILLTDKWAASIPYFQLLCIAGIFSPLMILNNSFLNIKGRSDIVLKLEIFKFILVMLSLAITIKMSIIHMIIGLVIARFICFIANAIAGGKHVNYSLVEQCKDMMPYVAISIVMSAVVFSLSLFINNLYILLISQIIVGFAFYVVMNKVLGSKIFEEVANILLKKGTSNDKTDLSV